MKKLTQKIIPETIPAWVNAGFSQIDSKRVHDMDDLRELYKKLASSQNLDLRKTWSTLDRFYSSLPFEMRDEFSHSFAFNLYFSSIGVPEYELLTKAERSSIVVEIEEVKEKIKKLIERTNSDFTLAGIDRLMNFANEDNPEDASEERHSHPLSKGIEAWAYCVTNLYNPQRGVIDRPTKGDVNLRFFCHTMTKHFYTYFEKPLYAATASLATVILESVIDQDYVRLTTRATVAKSKRQE